VSIATADLAAAINAVWDASTLDATFKALWQASALDTEFPVLHDQQAGGEQPWPYCIFEILTGTTTDQMSKGVHDVWNVRDVPVNFRVHTTYVDGDNRTPKEIAAFLIEEITKVFGGHPTQAPTGLALDNGNHLITIYQNDYSVREGEDHYQWLVSYTFRLDVPVMVTSA
jgi:hypothetical protein